MTVDTGPKRSDYLRELLRNRADGGYGMAEDC